MDIKDLEAILSERSGNKFCPICGTPFKPRRKRQKTCGAPECKREAHNEYLREKRRFYMSEHPEEFRKYRRDAMRKYRAKKAALANRDEELKELQERWQKQADFEKDVTEHGHEYGKRSAEKVLATVPKIKVTLDE